MNERGYMSILKLEWLWIHFKVVNVDIDLHDLFDVHDNFPYLKIK